MKIRTTLDVPLRLDIVGEYEPGRPGNYASRPEDSTPPVPAESCITSLCLVINNKRILLPDYVQAGIIPAIEGLAHEAFENEFIEHQAYMEEVING